MSLNLWRRPIQISLKFLLWALLKDQKNVIGRNIEKIYRNLEIFVKKLNNLKNLCCASTYIQTTFLKKYLLYIDTLMEICKRFRVKIQKSFMVCVQNITLNTYFLNSPYMRSWLFIAFHSKTIENVVFFGFNRQDIFFSLFSSRLQALFSEQTKVIRRRSFS